MSQLRGTAARRAPHRKRSGPGYQAVKNNIVSKVGLVAPLRRGLQNSCGVLVAAMNPSGLVVVGLFRPVASIARLGNLSGTTTPAQLHFC